ncbi:MAG TPA: UDP-N-acetylmuramate dehydrogenase [Candidatus Saccharimonadales bacterium]|nr:UDP-N-acetylmuramate dehydrogenase [Candidatus Saccharimonadales bacterium]
MQIQSDVSLKAYSTMRLGGNAAYLAHIHTEDELKEAIAWAQGKKLPVVMIGGGSNILWNDAGFPGLVLVNEIKGYREEQLNDTHYRLTIGAGEIWDDIVARTAEHGLSGIENLSLIPGTAGATPVQNVGAYSQEIANTLVEVHAYDAQSNRMVTIPKEECELTYRSSRFKTNDHGRFFITSIVLDLEKGNPQPPFYPPLQRYLDEHHITEFTPRTLREAVIAVRTAKLPDPKKIANNGSFFANPIISQPQLEALQAAYPDLTYWPVGDGAYKIPAAWLVQEAGFKAAHDTETGMATWPAQALVLVNEHAKSTADALKFEQKIIDAVQQKFGIQLAREPQVL